MAHRKKLLLLILGGVAAALVLAAAIFVLTFDINSYKPRIETAASEATGLEVSITGKMGLSFSPFGIAARDVHVANKGKEILSVESLKLGAPLMSLLKKQLEVTSCELVKPVFTIVKDLDGKYNYEGTGKKSTKGGPGTGFSMNVLKLSKGALSYLDEKTGEKTEYKDFNLSLKGVSIPGEVIKSASFTGSFDCKEVLQKGFSIQDLKASVRAAKGIYNIEPLAIGDLVYFNKKTGEKTEYKDINLALKDISIAGDVIKTASFTGNFDCKEVLQKDFSIKDLKAAVRASRGIYNFEPLAIGDLVYFDKKAGEKTELKGINLAIKDLSVVDAKGAFIRDISFTGSMDCKELRRKDLKLDNVKSDVKVEKGVIYFIPLTMDIFGSKAEGDITADKSKDEAVYKINLKVSKLDFAKLEESFGAKKAVGGKGDIYASLTMTEKANRSFLSSLEGTFSLRGDNLVTYTIDLDKVFSSYETSQEFNLVDVGAFFIAGPLGSVALKGYRYGDVYNQTRGGRGTIRQFNSHWKIRHGVADATDCALSTRHNRVALKGKLDLVGKRYDNVVVALLDDKGCVKMKQGINGPFGSPEIGAVNVAETLTGPIFNLFRKAKRLVEGDRCEVFYSGSVRQPPE